MSADPAPGSRVGLIGAGRWAEVHRDAIAAVGAELAGVAVATEASRERVERDWGVPATTDLSALFERELDAVIVASPNHLHAEHGAAALEAGAHVLVEKPMAITLTGCDRLLAAAKAGGRLLAVGHEMRVFRLFARVKTLLDAGAIGRPLHLALDLWRRPYRGGAGGWKVDPARVGSSVLEEPIHYLDLARWYLGAPDRLQAWAVSAPGREGSWDTLDVRLGFPGGAQALVTRSIAAYGHRVTLQLVGEQGSLRASWAGRLDTDPEPEVRLELHRGRDRDAPPERVDVPRHTGHAYDVPLQTRAFLDAAGGGPPPPATGADGRAAVALCLAVETSLRRDSSELELGPGGEAVDAEGTA